MKKSGLLFSFIITIVVFVSCGPSRNENSAMSSSEKSVYDTSSAISAGATDAGQMSSSAAVEAGSDTNRKFIRTAELRFRVPDVTKTTYKIEDITRANGGFVSYTNLSSRVDYEEDKSVSADSTLIITHYTISNSMTLRVPNTELDTLLKQLAPLVEFLDYRIIKATDVGLDLLANRLTRQRSQKLDSRLSKITDDSKSKAVDVTKAAESMEYSAEKADQALVSSLSLNDQIRFSTVTLEIYQRKSVKYNLIANEKNVEAYKPGFWYQAGEAVSSGFELLKEFVLFLLQIWWLLIVIALLFWGYPRYKKWRASSK